MTNDIAKVKDVAGQQLGDLQGDQSKESTTTRQVFKHRSKGCE
jgi:hypothetical protein